jgi:MFS family permease
MGKRTPSKWLTLIAACFGLLMLYIDLFIVNVALPTIGHDFRAPLGTASWTISG